MKSSSCALTLALTIVIAIAAYEPLYDSNGYPKHIPTYRVRRDVHSGMPVSRGKIQMLSDFRKKIELDKNITKIPLKEFRKLLQCAPHQPVFGEKIVHLLPPTYEIGI